MESVGFKHRFNKLSRIVDRVHLYLFAFFHNFPYYLLIPVFFSFQLDLPTLPGKGGGGGVTGMMEVGIINTRATI